MFLDGHDLYGIIASLDDAGQHLLAKLLVGAHFLALLRHADVALVDEQRVAAWLEALHAPLVGLLGCPHLGREYVGL